MAPRPFWKGYLKLSLVTCPVALTPATTDADKLRFHTLNRKTGNRVVSRYVECRTRSSRCCRPVSAGAKLSMSMVRALSS